MKAKKKLFIAGTVLLSLCSVAFFVILTYAFLNPDNFDLYLITLFEKEAYVICGACYLLFYHLIIQKAISRKSKVLLAVGSAVICSIQVFLLNNLFHYISFNEMFNWVEPARFLLFLIGDLQYIQNGQAFKYPLVFILMFSACLFDAFLLRKIVDLYNDVLFDGNKSDKNEN